MHQPVLLNEFLRYSECNLPGAILWDGTLGAAGHLISWLKKNPGGFACGSDQDAAMLEIAKGNLAKEEPTITGRYITRHSNFSENPFAQNSPFDVIFLDLGISSWHLDSLNRGISYRDTGDLDMRLDTSRGVPLSKWLLNSTFEEIREIIYKFGEDSYAPIIAKKIIEGRDSGEPLTPDWLNKICISAYSRAKNSAYVKNPGVKTFQAFRIFINDELGHLEKSLKFLPGLLKLGGVLIIISFHSLEDRLVKHSFRSLEKIKNDSMFAKSEYSPGDYLILSKKAIVPADDEIETNPRSRSAKMRVLQRIR